MHKAIGFDHGNGMLQHLRFKRPEEYSRALFLVEAWPELLRSQTATDGNERVERLRNGLAKQATQKERLMLLPHLLLPIFWRRVSFFDLRTGFARDIKIDHLPVSFDPKNRFGEIGFSVTVNRSG